MDAEVIDEKQAKDYTEAVDAAFAVLGVAAGAIPHPAAKVSVRKFLEDREAYLSLEGNEGYMSIPGAYAILRFGKGLKDDSFEDYDDIFVNRSADVGQSVFDDCMGRGNCDVYADLKYGQDLQLLIFPCPEERSGELAHNLAVALDADCSYNAGLPA